MIQRARWALATRRTFRPSSGFCACDSSNRRLRAPPRLTAEQRVRRAAAHLRTVAAARINHTTGLSEVPVAQGQPHRALAVAWAVQSEREGRGRALTQDLGCGPPAGLSTPGGGNGLYFRAAHGRGRAMQTAAGRCASLQGLPRGQHVRASRPSAGAARPGATGRARSPESNHENDRRYTL